MNNFITTDIGSMEYDKDFWNYMRGQKHVEDRLAAGKNRNNGTYCLPLTSNKAFLKALSEKSIFRKLGKVVKANEPDGKIFVSDAEEMAQWVAPSGVENIYEMVDEFRKIPTMCNKVAITIRTDLDFLKDNGFCMEQHTLPILTKSFARAEENAFINGTGVNMPKGILHETDGAEVGVTAEDTSDITFDEVIKLFTSVKPEYRANGVWLMSDETALKLRMLKDDNGNYIWNHNNDTILGKPVQISEFMPVCKSGAKTIAFGDFSYYWVLERMPMTIRPLVEKYALHNQIGHLAFEYLDGVLIRPEAIKVIQMA